MKKYRLNTDLYCLYDEDMNIQVQIPGGKRKWYLEIVYSRISSNVWDPVEVDNMKINFSFDKKDSIKGSDFFNIYVGEDKKCFYIQEKGENKRFFIVKAGEYIKETEKVSGLKEVYITGVDAEWEC